MVKMTFGQRLKMLRVEKGLNQQDFCNAFNINRESKLTPASISQKDFRLLFN